VIKSFRTRDTERLFSGEPVLRWKSIQKQAQRRLEYLDAAVRLEDLMRNPGNRFHSLAGDRAGQYAIWINMRWRVCFRWIDGNAWDVEIVDYH